jgi:hypothetical protein
MRRLLQKCLTVVINIVVLIALLGAIELYYRIWHPVSANEFPDQNGLWQKFHSYTMIMTAPGRYRQWENTFTHEIYSANVVTNSLGFNDPREFDYTTLYKKAANERVVLFSSGSVGWGVGSTSTDTTVAGRMQYYLNTLQSDLKYTVVNLSMGSWIAFQEFLALELWGETFDPDWIVVMDGFNDAGVGCAYSQGVGNPMYFATMDAYVNGYLFSTLHPAFYRGAFENELIKYSAAYRALTGKQYVPSHLLLDDSNSEDSPIRRQIIPTRVGESRGMLGFYVKSVRSMLKLYPDAKYIISTQPMVNQFTGDFVDIYQSPLGSEAHRAATAKREQALEEYLTHYENEPCGVKAQSPSLTYIFGNGAIQLERLADEMRTRGRNVEYHNTGTLFPEARPERMPYFIDVVHLTDKGNDVLGKFYAERILSRDAPVSLGFHGDGASR